MKTNLLIVCWEYPGVSSRQGTALARRIGQVAIDFQRNGWKVTVVHKDQVGEIDEDCKYKVINNSDGICRIVFADSDSDSLNWFQKNVVVRKLTTLIHAIVNGDRTYSWANLVIRELPEVLSKESFKPELIISFFTPRAPLIAGRYLSSYYNIPWIADFQDCLDEGYTGIGASCVGYWTRGAVKSAIALTHVSPEWAARDGAILGRTMISIRHALPLISDVPILSNKKEMGVLNVLFSGSIDVNHYDLSLFIKVIQRLSEKGIKVTITLAGNLYLKNLFESSLQSLVDIVYLGWLSSQELYQQIILADCLLVVPYSKAPRQLIPSKFFEFAAFNKPVWIIGNDTGAFEILFNEYGHDSLKVYDEEFQLKAAEAASRGDYSQMFLLENCSQKPLKADELFMNFERLITQ